MSAKRVKREAYDATGPSNRAPEEPVLPKIALPRGALTTMNQKIQAYETLADAARERFANLGVTDEEIEGALGEVVRAMLTKMHEKSGAPVKRGDLVSLITSVPGRTHKKYKQLPQLVIPLAQAKMASALGIDMREVKRVAGSDAAVVASRKRAAAAAAGGGGGGGQEEGAAAGAAAGGSVPATITYVLSSLLPPEVYTGMEVGEEAEAPARGLLMTVLGLLELQGDSMPEEELWRHLRGFGIVAGQEHPAFAGRPEEQLGRMVAQRYLTHLKGTGGAGGAEGRLLGWGEVAEEVIGRAAVRAWVEEEFKASKAALLAAAVHRGDQENQLPGE